MRKLRWVAALLTAMILVAAACTSSDEGGTTTEGDGGSGEPVTLDFWVFDEGGIGTFLKTLVADFEKANPNVTVKVTAFPEDNYGVKLDTALAAGRGPDLVLVFGPDYMRRGLLMPLDDMVAEHDIDLSTFSQAIVEGPSEFSCSWNDTLYCLGSYQGAVMMFYNKDMFDDAGIEQPSPWPGLTVDEFVDTACELTDPANEVWGAAYGDPMEWMPWEVVVSEDGHTANGYVNGPAAVETYETLARGVTEGCAPTLNVLDPWEQGTDFFARGKLAMVVTDFQSLKKIEKAGINYGVSAQPTPEGVEPFFYVWSDSVGVMADSDNPEEAQDFVAFLATEGQRIRYRETNDIPLDTAIADELDWAKGIPGRQEGLEVLSHARPPVFIPNRWDTYGPIFDVFGLVLGGEASAQDALNEAAGAIQENLDKAWRTWEKEEAEAAEEAGG